MCTNCLYEHNQCPASDGRTKIKLQRSTTIFFVFFFSIYLFWKETNMAKTNKSLQFKQMKHYIYKVKKKKKTSPKNKKG